MTDDRPPEGETFSSSVVLEQSAAAPETLLASADMPPQSQINDEIARLHRQAAEREAAGEVVPATLYDFPPYRSSLLRHPTKNPRLVDPETIELYSPAYGQRDVAAIESDLTLQHRGEPQGERITVTGGCSTAGAGPFANQLVEIWQANAAGRYIHQRDQHPAPLDPNFTGAGRTVTNDERRVLLHDDQAGPVSVEEPRQRVASGAHPLLGVRLRIHAAHHHADVLPGRPAVPARPDLQHHPATRRTATDSSPRTTTTSRCPNSRWATGGTSWSTAPMPPGSSPRGSTDMT